MPKGLRFFFVVHFFADMAFAIPLMIAPKATLELFGWTTIDPVTTRIVAAALFGIGIESLLSRNAPLEAFRSMLGLKIIWSGSVIVGLVICLIEGAPTMVYAILAIFMAFNALWVTYRIKVGKALAH